MTLPLLKASLGCADLHTSNAAAMMEGSLHRYCFHPRHVLLTASRLHNLEVSAPCPSSPYLSLVKSACMLTKAMSAGTAFLAALSAICQPPCQLLRWRHCQPHRRPPVGRSVGCSLSDTAGYLDCCSTSCSLRCFDHFVSHSINNSISNAISHSMGHSNGYSVG